MLSNLLKRGEQLASETLERGVAEIAAQLRSTVAGAGVSIEDSRVIFSGRGLVKRWLTDPAVRFLGWAGR